jgi:hypothetical protein
MVSILLSDSENAFLLTMFLSEAVCGVPASKALFEIRAWFSCRHDEPEPDFKQAVNSNV